jgi:C-terminal processing protease CtpA/Prc
LLGIVEANKLAEIVGETTAGTNGNINAFVHLGGYRVLWTGMKVVKHDGSRHHGVGIHPTTPATRATRSVTAAHNELLRLSVALVGGRGGTVGLSALWGEARA